MTEEERIDLRAGLRRDEHVDAEPGRRSVALVTRYPPAGAVHVGRGVAAYSKLLATAIAEQGWSVTVLAEVVDGAPSHYVESGVTVVRCWRYGWRAIGDILHAVDALSPDVVHLQHELFLFGRRAAALVPDVLLRALRKRASVITTIHGVVPRSQFRGSFASSYAGTIPPQLIRSVYGKTIGGVVRYSDAVVVHSDAVLAALEDYCRPRRYEVIPVGVEENAGRMSREEALNALDLADRPRAVFFGFLLPYKGVELLEQAAEALEQNGLEVLIAGGESGDGRLTHRRRAARPAQVVKRLPEVPEALIPALFAVADVLVLPYTVGLAASGPLCLAAGFGTPVAISDVATLTSIVHCPAATFRRGDVDALVECVTRVAFDEATRATVLGRLATIARESTWTHVAQRTVAAYQGVLRPATPAAGTGVLSSAKQ